MSASKISNAAEARKVTRETAEVFVLHLPRNIKKIYGDSRVFKKVLDWCEEHFDDPEPVIEKDPLTHECKWFTFTDYEKSFFDVPVSELLELVMAANYFDIPRLYHYACQAVAARIKGQWVCGVCEMLLQNHDRARINKIYMDNPWLWSVPLRKRIKNVLFIPDEVLVTIFEKLPREDLEHLRAVSTRFYLVIMRNVELSGHLPTPTDFRCRSRHIRFYGIFEWHSHYLGISNSH